MMDDRCVIDGGTPECHVFDARLSGIIKTCARTENVAIHCAVDVYVRSNWNIVLLNISILMTFLFSVVIKRCWLVANVAERF